MPPLVARGGVCILYADGGVKKAVSIFAYGSFL